MGGGRVDFEELRERSVARASKPSHEVLSQRGLHEGMDPSKLKVRECLASDTSPKPLPIAFVLDTTGSMGHLPLRLAKEDLLRLLNRLTQTAAVGQSNPQICFAGVADTHDETPFQVGQFEADNRMDDWLTKIHIGGGSGSETMHEQYGLALYFLARKCKCEIWDRNGKGYAFIAGDEKCPSTLMSADIARVFGDRVNDDVKLADLLEEVGKKWNLFFLYAATEAYGPENVEPIWGFWKKLMGSNAIRLDKEATAVPEIVSALIGIGEGVFKADEVQRDLLQLGCDQKIVGAVATALGLEPEGATGDEKPAKKRGPKAL